MTDKISSETRKLALDGRLNQDREDQQYTDITIKCGDVSFAAHKIVLATASDVLDYMVCGQFKEANTGVVDLSSEKVEYVKALIDYMYLQTYSAGHLEDHIRIFILADQYNVQSLMEHALENVGRTLSDVPAKNWHFPLDRLPNWTVEGVVEMISLLWHEPSPAHLMMRRCIMRAIWKHRKLLLSYQVFRDLIMEGGEFVLEFVEGFKQPAMIMGEFPDLIWEEGQW